MYTLAFDTTARSCSIALLKDKRMISSFEEEMDFGQSEVLIPEIKEMLNEQNLSFGDIGLLLVCTGPGSFTGVRASISAARAFGLASEQLVVSGVPAFDAYATSLSEEERADVNAVIIETKRDDFYIQLFDKNLKKISDSKTAVRDDIISELKNKSVSLVGDGVERFLYTSTGLVFKTIKMMPYLPIETFALCGIKKFEDKITDFPKPLYLRAPDVCIKQV